ncbi:MAG: viologen exporter family transport system permease protein [Actinomycetota bacterium]|jgi:ABC-2 type transport system permease protein|nr:viologen exporter family transport system permease protein [Actinomycetota bacterium]
MNALLVTSRGAIAEAWANRSAFWTQVAIMVLNDIAWVAFWLLFFHRVGQVHGWSARSVLLLLAIVTTSAGLVLGVFANARSIGRLIAGGELDAALALPVATLPYLLVRRVNATNIGDVLFGVGLFVFACHPTPARTALFLAGTAVAAVLLTGFLVMTGSSAFFAGRDDVGELSFQAMLLLSSYPVDVFGPAAKVLLYTALPAAFVSSVPAKQIESFHPVVAAVSVGVAALFAVAGWVTFRLGLRRYTSGAVWTRA